MYNYIIKCNACGKVLPDSKSYPKPSQSAWARFDYYNIFTGIYCEECYNDPHKYPYKKDAYYDYFEAGEHLEPDDY